MSSETGIPVKKRKLDRPKRASIACVHCRRRKVRCDVVSQCGPPCTNCRLDCIDCALSDRKRHYFREHISPASRSPSLGGHSQRPVPSTRDGGRDSPISHDPELSGVQQIVDLASNQSTKHSPTDSGHGDACHASLADPWTRPGDFPAAASPTTQQAGARTTTAKGRAQPGPMPCFITCDLSTVCSEDVAYLQNKGCFNFPDKSILDELLLSYFDHVAPYMPFIDETGFWEMYHAFYYDSSQGVREAHRSGISLLLFQAMLFAATTCAPMTVLSRLGYASRSIARRDAFFRVRALYALNVERDRLVLIQTFLLMSYWRGDAGEDKDVWHWVGLAVSTALDIGLHRRSKTSLSERQSTLQRRLWWSCVLRDRLAALSKQREPRIQLDKSDVSMLTLADYNVSLRSGLGGLMAAEELGKRTAMSMFSLQMIQLVLCMEREGLSSAVPHKPTTPGAHGIWARTRRMTEEEGAIVGHAELDHWRLNLPEVLQPSSCPEADESVLPCILVHRDALQTYYHKFILSIATRRLQSMQKLGQDSPQDAYLVRSSSAALAKIHGDLLDRDSLHCLPDGCFDSAFSTSIGARSRTNQLADLSVDIEAGFGGLSHFFGADFRDQSKIAQSVSSPRFGQTEEGMARLDTVQADTCEDLPWFVGNVGTAASISSDLAADSSSVDESSLHTSLLNLEDLDAPEDVMGAKPSVLGPAASELLEGMVADEDVFMFS